MAVLYNDLHVDEQYSSILEANLYYNPVFVPGITFTDKYQKGPGGAIFVHKPETNSVDVGKPGRDFTDELAKDELIQIVLNNNFQKSKKIYGVQAQNVGYQLGEERLSTAIKECGEGWQQSAAACLVNEGTDSAINTAITVENLKEDLIATRTELVKKKGRANVVMCSPEYYGMVLLAAGSEFTPVHNDRIAATGQVGNWLGFTFIENNGLSATNAKYYDFSGALKTVSFGKVQYIMYYHETLSIVTNFEAARIVDSENFVGSKAQVEKNTGYRVTNPVLTAIRKIA